MSKNIKVQGEARRIVKCMLPVMASGQRIGVVIHRGHCRWMAVIMDGRRSKIIGRRTSAAKAMVAVAKAVTDAA